MFIVSLHQLYITQQRGMHNGVSCNTSRKVYTYYIST